MWAWSMVVAVLHVAAIMFSQRQPFIFDRPRKSIIVQDNRVTRRNALTRFTNRSFDYDERS